MTTRISFFLVAFLHFARCVFAADPSLELPPPTPLAEDYYRSGNLWWLAGVFWSLFVPWLFLQLRLAPRLSRLTERWGRGRTWVALFAFTAVFWLYLFVMNLPFGYFVGFVREHDYGLSDQLFSKWALDRVKGILVSIAAACSVIWLPYWLFRRAPQRWWLITGLCALPYFLFALLISPLWIDPLFNDFHRLKDPALEKKIIELAHQAGVDTDQVYEVDKSVDTHRMNAYVTGFLGIEADRAVGQLAGETERA